MLSIDNDPMGQAISNYFFHADQSPILVNTNITEGEELSVSHLFRKFDSMPKLEKIALEMVSGKTLDVGAGAGAHSLFLQNNGFDVTAIDVSLVSCEVMRCRGINKVQCKDIWAFESDSFDTILFMMNGIGLAKNLEGLEHLLIRLRKMININGQLLLDSSDVKYMFENDDGSLWIDLHKDYYGDLDYSIGYKDMPASTFPWLFVGYDILKEIAIKSGWSIEHIYQDDNYHFLARLTLNSQFFY